MSAGKMDILYLPHGGGPLPLLGDERHAGLVRFLQTIPQQMRTPDVIIVVSAHWEEALPTVSGAASPGMIYDYYGFPEPAYTIRYPAPGAPAVAAAIVATLKDNGIEATVDPDRGFDHGTFVPLLLMYPEAAIPVVQVSLVDTLDPAALLAIGAALAAVAAGDTLLVGSGMSYHNMAGFMSGDPQVVERSAVFDQWLNDVVVGKGLTASQRSEQLRAWAQAPAARHCHPREEHLLPLHVCCGAGQARGLQAVNVFREPLLGAEVSGFLWTAEA